MVKSFVLDCSVTMAWCLREGPESYVDSILQKFENGDQAFVPPLWYYEVSNSFINAKRRRRISTELIHESLKDLQKFPIRVIQPDTTNPLSRLIDEVYLAELHQLTFYDASYLILALQHNLPLATLDKALKKAAQSAHIPDAGTL